MESECHLYFSFHHNVIVFADKGVLKSPLHSLSKALGQTKAGLRLLHFWARGIDGMSPTWGYGKCRQGTNIRAVFSGGPSLSGGLGFWDRFLCLSRLLAYTKRSQSGMLKVTPTSFRRERFHHTHPCTIHKEELEAFSQTEHSRAQTKNHDVHTRWAPFLKGNHYLVEKGMVTHSSTLAWRTLWTDEAGGLWSTGSQRVGHDWSSWAPSLSWLLALLVLNLMYMDSQSVYSGVWFLSRCVCVWSRHAFTLTLHSSPSSAYTTHLSVHPPADGNWIVSSFSATFNSVATNTLIQFPSNTCVHFC